MLHVHRSERADALVAPLATVLADPLDDPFTPEVIAVPTHGVERWIAQRLAHHLGAGAGEAGVCANVQFPSPSKLIVRVTSEALGETGGEDPWAMDRLTWSILQVLDDSRGEPWCAVVDRYLAPAADGSLRDRRLGLARRLAQRFTSYAAQRPDMLSSWAAGQDVDGAGGPVPQDLTWQVELWRRLHATIDAPNPAQRLAAAVAAIQASGLAVSLPRRVSVLGATRLSEAELRLVAALAVHRDMHLWMVHPSPALWSRIAACAPQPHRRRDRAPVASHRLVASMAADIAELQSRLATVAGTDMTDTRYAAPAPPSTLLGALQQRLRDDAPDHPGAASGAAHLLRVDDRSIVVHACHGRARQVEVLREVLVGLFQADPTLEPRDVIVMCPDVESIAPLVAATFGSAVTEALDGDRLVARAGHPGHRLRIQVADRSLHQTNPLLSLVARLLELADGRVTASEVLDLVASPPVRALFAFSDDDLDRLRTWSIDAGARWGEDVGRRARFGLDRVRQGTWDYVMDRLLLGVAMADENQRFIGAALPLDDVDSTDVALAGRFAELLARLTHVLSRLEGQQPLDAWLDALEEALTLLGQSDAGQGWQLVQARAVLGDVRAAALQHGVTVGLGDVRALLTDRLAGRPTRAGFRTGALTVCSMEPMRAIPHRVVCLLGLDDGVFPRTHGQDGDDLLAREPCVGERDRRSEDRQLFLDAVMSAGERLVVLYTGADERTGASRPPAVPVAELLDALDAAAETSDGRRVRDHVVIRHPLQPVDERYFTPGALHTPGPFSFDTSAYAASLAGRSERSPVPPFLQGRLAEVQREGDVDLEDLVAFVEHPVRWFLRRRLGLTLLADLKDLVDQLPLELDPLTKWAVGDRLLEARLAGVDREQARLAEWRRGHLPPRRLAGLELDKVLACVDPIAAAVSGYATAPPGSRDVAADLPSVQEAVTGTVNGIHPWPAEDVAGAGWSLVRAVFSKLAPKHRIRSWVQLLALAATYPDERWRAVTVGRGVRPGAVVVSVTAAPPAHVAAQRLEDLVRLRERALREPLPMPVAASAAYARARLGGDSPEQALAEAQKDWRGAFEHEDRFHTLVWGERATILQIAGTPSATEGAWSPDGSDTTRLGVLARRVWGPVMEREVLTR